MGTSYLRARHGALDKDFEKLGIKRDIVLPKEDGMRTGGAQGSYEWWYCDAEFTDKTKIVVVFYTKNHFDVQGAAHPTVNISITFPDQTKLIREFQEDEGKLINADKEKCTVKIGQSYLIDEGGFYTLHFEHDNVCYHAKMTATLPMWRPDTGEIFFGDNDEHFFAWLVAQPSCTVDAALTVDGKSQSLSGTGYHDHNWGNIGMQKLMNHWYWGRAKVGDYTVIACDIIAGKKYGYKRFPIFFLAKDGKIISDKQSLTKITRNKTVTHPVTGKFMDNELFYKQPISETEFYTIQFDRIRDIASGTLLSSFKPFAVKLLKLVGVNPTYTRTEGNVTVTHSNNGEISIAVQEGLWEQMFFGANKDAIIDAQ
ncbi:MAG: lipocalin-like domain-containing protein [Oscillospiraceae bacterium]